ncbi:Rv1355c family protein [Nocardia anaemiae]|uniref:Rv1355c family protein n=1 Tax=Nocardia anaemiae TaxID=263910 RepID=UPI0007A4D3F2|nr:Rv1355c family protein [Nocardia anaemiae]
MRIDVGRDLRERADQNDDLSEWRPVHFDLAIDRDRSALSELLAATDVRVLDTLSDQLRQLVLAREPACSTAELDERVRLRLGETDPAEYGRWVWYPWSADLVHVLPEAEFREVRTDRNRYRITREEQQRLARMRIGVVGLSVGNAAALTLALEGIGGSFKIADCGRLDLSNLNRIRARVADLGIEKSVMAARQMFEIDPYLRIERCPRGIRPEAIDDFLLGGGGLDLVVEGCDDLHTKALVRERARVHGIPVLMPIGDRGLLDIERFDIEPDRPIFHGLLGSVRAADLRDLTTSAKLPHVLGILDAARISTRAAASLPELGRTIGSWPQLASGAALGGAIVADAARRLLLGEPVASGRYYVDPAELIDAGHGSHHEPAPPAPLFAVAEEARRDPPLPPQPSERGVVSDDAVRWIAAMGALAPSAHNAQPWALTWRRATAVLECRHDPKRDLPSLDFAHGATWVAFGALLENIELAAGQLGLRTRIRTWPDADLVATVELSGAPELEGSPLVAQIPTRVTNRRRELRRPLDAELARSLVAACAEFGGRLQLSCERTELAEIGALIGAADRIGLLNRAMHRDTMSSYRWTPEEVRAEPYGIDIATAELTEAERAALRLLGQWRVAESLAEIGGGRALEDLSRRAVTGAAAVGLLTVPGVSRESYLLGGRAMQRMWLTAAAEGIALQPMTALPYLFARLERGGGHGLGKREQAELRELRVRYRRVFDTDADHAEVLLFRLAHAGPPTARSLRRPLVQVLEFA